MKWSDGIWKDLAAIQKVTFSFLSSHLLPQQGKMMRVRKIKPLQC